MIDLSKFDPSAPWYEYLYYQKTCEDKGKPDSVQDWQEQRGDIEKPKPKVTAKGRRLPGVTEGWTAPIIDDPKTRSVEIMYEGKAYPSISAAAKAHGVSAQTISRRLGRYKK